MVQPASEINVLSQLGFESSPGAGGAANYAIQATMIEQADEVATVDIAAQGHRFDTGVAIDKAWSTLKLSGRALYTETLLAIENICGTVAPTTPAGALTARKRVYDVPLTGLITPRTWTGQFGDPSDNVNQWALGFLTDLGFKADRDSGVNLDGLAGLAQIIATGSSFTASPTALPNIPIDGAHMEFYLDSTGAALGTTKLPDELLGTAWSIKGLKAARWVADRTLASFKGYTDLKPKCAVSLDMAEDATTRALVSQLRLGQRLFLRINAQGPLIDNLQTVTITGSPTGGTFTLTYKSQTTAAIAFNAAASAVQTALLALTSIGAGNASVTGGAGGPYTVSFIGTLAQDTAALTGSGALLTPSGGVTIAAAPFNYLLSMDIGFQLAKIGARGKGSGASEGVWMRTIEGNITEDTAWGHAVLLTSQTGIATL